MKKYLLLSIALLTSIVTFAQNNYPKVTGLGSNGKFIITVNAADQIKNLNFNLEETQVIDGVETTVKPYEALQTATEIRVVTEGTTKLSADDMTKLCSSSFSMTTLDLENAEIENISSTGNANPLLKLKNSSTITSIVFPSQNGMVIPSQCFGTSGNNQIQSIVIPDNKGTYTISSQACKTMTALTSVTIGSGVTSLHDETFANCTSLVNADIHEGLQEIRDNVFGGCSSLTKIVLPEGLTTIGYHAFMRCAFTSIRLPNSLTTIEEEAFIQCNGLTEVVIPENVVSIGKQAFNECLGLLDVYVLGEDTKCAEQGFNNNQTHTGYSYRNNNDGVINNLDWSRTQSGVTTHPVVLHYPEGQETKFLNLMLRYITAYYQAETQAEKDDVLSQVDTDFPRTNYYYRLNIKNTITNNYGMAYFYDEDNDIAYMYNPGGWFDDATFIGNSSSSTQEQKDYAGWKQFMFSAPIKAQKKWPDTRMIDDKWYSMCLPFPMTATQLGNAFGNTVEVCKFSGVDVQTNGTKKLITLKFKERVTTTQAHVPYMIHPGIHSDESGTGVITNTIVGVQLADGFDRESVEKTGELTDVDTALRNSLRIKLSSDGIQTVIDADGIRYTFRGNYFAGEKLPAYTYYWWPGDATWPASFYKTMTANQVTWSPYTSVVLCSADNGAADAKMVYFIETEDELFEVDEEEMGIATTIQKPSSIEGKNTSFDGKVMNMNGQVVSDSANDLNGLPKGIYIVNGKKYVVR